jgi:hypothetical protein
MHPTFGFFELGEMLSSVRINCRKKESDQNGDNRDDHEKFDNSKAAGPSLTFGDELVPCVGRRSRRPVNSDRKAGPNFIFSHSSFLLSEVGDHRDSTVAGSRPDLDRSVSSLSEDTQPGSTESLESLSKVLRKF